MTLSLPYIIHGLVGNESLKRTFLFSFFFSLLPDSLYVAVSRDEEKREGEGGIFCHAVQSAKSSLVQKYATTEDVKLYHCTLLTFVSLKYELL